MKDPKKILHNKWNLEWSLWLPTLTGHYILTTCWQGYYTCPVLQILPMSLLVPYLLEGKTKGNEVLSRTVTLFFFFCVVYSVSHKRRAPTESLNQKNPVARMSFWTEGKGIMIACLFPGIQSSHQRKREDAKWDRELWNSGPAEGKEVWGNMLG